MSALTSMLAQDEKINKRPTYRSIDIDEIEVNKNNIARICDIDELAESIRLYGLMKPLEVYETDEGSYRLLGGERRYTALKKLVDMGEDIDTDVPCLVYRRPDRTSVEKLQLILSNAQREETEEDRISTVKMLLEILDDDKDLHVEGRKRDWIAQFIGKSPRTVQKYINIATGKEKPAPEPSPEEKPRGASSPKTEEGDLQDEKLQQIEEAFSSAFFANAKAKKKKKGVSVTLSFSDSESLENAVLMLESMKGGY